jgi:hypothetical protein
MAKQKSEAASAARKAVQAWKEYRAAWNTAEYNAAAAAFCTAFEAVRATWKSPSRRA